MHRPVDAQSERRDAEVTEAVHRFLRSFENLEWEGFRQSFSDDATVFFPTPEPARRFSGRKEYESQFKKVFATIRAGSRTKQPPFHRLAPVNQRIDFQTDDVATVTFLLINDQRIARRTLVMWRDEGEWRIVHLHASNVAP